LGCGGVISMVANRVFKINGLPEEMNINKKQTALLGAFRY
jgi:hypothetical protein